jgi:hypothetical protein
MNTFILLGTLLLIASNAYIPWSTYKRLLGLTFGGIYRGHREGTLPRRPAWSFALQALGFGLLVLGFWRVWAA